MSKKHLKSIMLPSFILLSLFFFLSSGGSLDASLASGDYGDEVKTGIVPLQSIKELKKVSKDFDFVYVILPSEQETGDSVRKTVLSAAANTDKQANIGMFEINRETEGFKKFVRKYNVKAFPAVIAMNSSGEVETVQGEISQEKLMNARAKVSGEKKKLNCPMSEGKPCNPKACGKDKGK